MNGVKNLLEISIVRLTFYLRLFYDVLNYVIIVMSKNVAQYYYI